MSFDPETTRIVRSWLDEGVTQLPDRVLDSVLDQVPATAQRRATWWPARRISTMNSTLKFGLAAAVVAVAVLIGITYLGTANPGGPDPAESILPATPETTPTPTAAAIPSRAPDGNLTAGETWSLSLPGYPTAINVVIPAPGWGGEAGNGFITKGDGDPPGGAGIITFADPGYHVYGDPCQWSSTRPETPATTVDALVAALAAQSSRDASAPVDVTVDGYSGKSMILHVPDDVDFADCDEETFASWGVPGEDPARYQQSPGQIDKLWIVDVDGELVIIDAGYYEGTPQADLDEIEAMVASVSFD